MSSIQPGNPSEWQLYRVLQRSNLLQYYDTFIAQGKSLRSRIMCNLDLVIQNKLYILRYLRSCFLLWNVIVKVYTCRNSEENKRDRKRKVLERV